MAEQPHRLGIPERQRPRSFPWNEYPEIEAPGRPWPCGYTDGGFLYGPAEECRAADVMIEDSVGPPLYCTYPRYPMTVESTHTETLVYSTVEGGLRAMHKRIMHPGGIR